MADTVESLSNVDVPLENVHPDTEPNTTSALASSAALHALDAAWTAAATAAAVAPNADAPTLLLAVAQDGLLVWRAGAYTGTARCAQDGTGQFSGAVPALAQRLGRFELELGAGRVKAVLRFMDAQGRPLGTFSGFGVQSGLTGTWKGAWVKRKEADGDV